MLTLRISGFQSHKDTAIDISPGVNAISGVSGTGKSGILRALDLVANNNPPGDDYLPNSYKYDECNVTLSEDSEGWAVSRIKTKSKNQYILKQKGKKDQVFEGFNREVPPPIKSIINIQDFNLRFQHQSPFLMNESSGAVSRYLNKIARLDLIDKAITNITSQLKDEKEQRSVEESLLLKASDQLKRFEPLPDIELHLSVLESADRGIKADTIKYNAILDLCDEAKNVMADRWEQRKVLELKIKVEKLLVQQDEIKKVQGRYSALINIYDDCILISADIRKQQSIIIAKDRVLSLILLNTAIKELKIRRNVLDVLIRDLRFHQKKIIETQQELTKLKKDFDVLMPQKCPLCGRGDK